MRPAYLLIGVLLCVLCIGAASAETYIFEGTTANGQYSATLVEGDDGSAALSLAAVSGGTMSPGSSGSLEDPAPVPTVNTMVFQDLMFDVRNGQGFAGCSVIGASGDQASTGTWISGTSANVSQEAGTFDTSWWENIALNGVYAGQEVLSPPVGAFTLPVSCGFVKSATWAASAKDDSALVEVNSTGPLMVLQGATAGSVIAAFDPLYVGVNGAIAGQTGIAGTPEESGTFQVAPGGNVDVSGTATDAQGTTASTSTQVGNGFLSFGQVVGAGTLDGAYDFFGAGPSEGVLGANISGAFAVQDVYGDGSVSSESSASSATGHSASAGLITDGAFEFTQGALAGGLSAGYNTSSAGINCALAGQGGAFETSGTGLLTGTAGDANGNSVSTGTTLTDGSADLFVQVVGSGNADVNLDLEDLFGIPGAGPQAGISGVFGGQYVDGDGSSVSAFTNATSDAGNSANVTLSTDGTFDYGQVALAGSASASYNTSTAGIGYAVAGQGGSFTTSTGGTGLLTGTADDANGNSVFTVSGVQNGSLSFFQMVGAGNVDVHLDADLIGITDDDPEGSASGVFGIQYMNGESTDGMLGSFTEGVNGDNVAVVAAGSTGNVTGWVAQGVVASDVHVDTGLEDVDDILVSGALAGQVGRFQNTTAVGSTNAGASGFGINSQGDDALVFSEAENGTLNFAQMALAGGVDAGETGNVTAALAMQVSNVTGTGGLVEARTSNAAGDESRVNVTFSNLNNKPGWIASASAAGSGEVNSPYLIPLIGDDSISGTGAGLYEFGRDGTMSNYNMTAYAHLDGSGSDFVYRTGKANLHYAYAYTGLGDWDAKIGNH